MIYGLLVCSYRRYGACMSMRFRKLFFVCAVRGMTRDCRYGALSSDQMAR